MVWVAGRDRPGKFQPKKISRHSHPPPPGLENRPKMVISFDDPPATTMTTFLQQLKLLDRSMDLLETWTGCRGGRGECSEGVEILMTQRHDVVRSRKFVLATVGVFLGRLL